MWDDFHFVLTLARSGTLRRAASSLGVDQATVGRRISSVEAKIGAKLFEKSSDGFIPTAQASLVLDKLGSIEETFFSIERSLAGSDKRAAGNVHVAAPGALANQFLIPHLQQFVEDYPDLVLQFLTGPEVVNLSRRDADLALRLVKPAQKELWMKKQGFVEVGVFASEKILKRKGGAVHVKDLQKFPFIGLFPEAASVAEKELLKVIQKDIRVQMRSAAWTSTYAAVRAGIGVGILPAFFRVHDPKIVHLSFVEPVKAPLWLVVHPDLRKSMRLRVVIENFEKIFADHRSELVF